MSILGIKNRTENWSMVNQLLGGGISSVAHRLKCALDGGSCFQSTTEPLEMEFFWYGYRDYIKSSQSNGKDFYNKMVQRYNKLFPNLRSDIENFVKETNDLRPVSGHNYVANKETSKKLFNNLLHTEIDIILETNDNIYIGEVKDSQNFDAKSKYVLVHQLLRQYVMVSMLVDEINVYKNLVPFIIGNDDSIKRKGQVYLMKRLGYLKSNNVLCWPDII